METGFLDRLANQLKVNKSATCRRASQIKQPMREYMQDYRDKREPKRVWRRIVIKFLGPRKSWGE